MRAFIEEIVHTRGTGVSALAAQLGYKSANSLYRLMDENVRLSSLKQFKQRIIDNIDLSKEELEKLTNAIEIKEYGEERSNIFRAVSTMIEGLQIRAASGGNEKKKKISNDLIDLCCGSVQIHVLLFNSLREWVIDQICELLNSTDAYIDHYMNVPLHANDVIRNFGLLTNVLYHQNYHGYVPKYYLHGEENHSQWDIGLEGMSRADIALFSLYDSNGNFKKILIIFTEDGIQVNPADQLEIKVDPSKYLSVKRGWPSMNALEDYLSFFKECAALDSDHTTYMLKPDISVGLISGDILVNLLAEGKTAELPGIENVLNDLQQLFNDRYANNLEKKKHTFCVLTQTGMHEFIKTGLMSDHFWVMRPFTPAERLKVMQMLAENLHNNRHLHFFFLKNDRIMGPSEIDLYEGEGILIQSKSTSYQLSGSHAEIMITHPIMMKWYREYFLSVLVKAKCYSETESLAIFDALVKECEQINQTIE